MFKSFDEKSFYDAIKKKDYLRLKIYTVSAIRNDPIFKERGEVCEIRRILEKEVPEIFEKYVQKDYEERLEESQWSEEYFIKLTFWFQENFAKSRLEHIREVGRAVHKNEYEQYERRRRERRAQNAQNSVKSTGNTKSQGKKPNFSITKVAVAILVILLLIMVIWGLR